MNIKLENIYLKQYGFELVEQINPVGHTDYIINRNLKFIRREDTLNGALLFCTRILFRELYDGI